MRFQSIPTLIRTLHTFSNSAIRIASQVGLRSLYQATTPRATFLRSMPIPFLSSFFSGNSKNMASENFPVQKTEGEWQAILSPGKFLLHAQFGFLSKLPL